MSLIIPANSASAASGYQVDNSCRFNDGSSDHMFKTASAGNRRTFTFSTWFKRGQLSTNQQFFTSYSAANAGGFAYMQLEAPESGVIGDRISLEVYGTILLKTNQVLRDPSSWYNLVIAVDTTSGTANNRCRMYLNGTEITSFATRNNPDQNFDFAYNQNSVDLVLGSNNYGGNKGNYFDGYLAETVWIDGTQYAASDFGEFDEDSGIWKPIDVSGLTFGNNGFYLDFEDSGDLGDDESGNGNDFAETNLAAIDQSTDTCTNNFATLNVLNKGTSVSLSEGNLAYTAPSGSFASVLSTIGFSQGKWYAEYQWKSGSNSHVGIGKENINYNHYLSYTANGYSYYKDGRKFNNSSASSYGNSYAVDDIIGVALDLDNGAIWFSKNGTWQNSATLTEIQNGTTTNAAFTSLSGEFFFGTGMGNSNELAYFNFGSPPYSESGGETDGNGYGNFAHEVPSGYYSLNTKNLAEYG